MDKNWSFPPLFSLSFGNGDGESLFFFPHFLLCFFLLLHLGCPDSTHIHTQRVWDGVGTTGMGGRKRKEGQIEVESLKETQLMEALK